MLVCDDFLLGVILVESMEHEQHIRESYILFKSL